MQKKNEKWEKIANEFVVSLFPVYGLIKSLYSQYQKKIGKPALLLIIIEHQALTYYIKKTNWNIIHNVIVKKVESNPDFLFTVFKNIEKVGREQIRFLKKNIKNLKKLTNSELNKIYQKYVTLNEIMYYYGTLISFLDFQDTTYFCEKVKKILAKYSLSDLFEPITTPLNYTYNKKNEIDLLYLYNYFLKNKKLTNLFKKENSDTILKKLKLNKYLYKKLNLHTKKYCWVNYVYEGPAADNKYFLEILIDMHKRKINPVNELKSVLKDQAKIEKIHKKLLANKHFTQNEKYIIKNASKIVFFKPYRRELQSYSYFLMEQILKEIANRLSLSIGQVRMMMSAEVNNALIKDKINLKILNERLNNLLFYVEKNKEICLTGSLVRNYASKYLKKENKIINTKSVIGTCSYGGKVKGIIKMVNTPKDMEKMNNGDILLACTTNPNLMPAIRKAKAIITDEGGLTCHAAIVSREMRIPCVIGTKIATQVLKDGDQVEVDANKGIIRKL